MGEADKTSPTAGETEGGTGRQRSHPKMGSPWRQRQPGSVRTPVTWRSGSSCSLAGYQVSLSLADVETWLVCQH